MSSLLVWFLGVLLCGLGVSIVIGGLSLNKEGVCMMFMEDDFVGFICFAIIGLFADLVGFALFCGGYKVFRSVL